jgi:hypothetical protein
MLWAQSEPAGRMRPLGRFFEAPALSAVQFDWCLLAKRKWRAVHEAVGQFPVPSCMSSWSLTNVNTECRISASALSICPQERLVISDNNRLHPDSLTAQTKSGVTELCTEQSSFSEGDSFSGTQEILRIVCHRKVHYHVHNSTPLVSTPSKINPINALLSCFYKIHFNIIPPYKPKSSKRCFSFRIPTPS